MAAHAGGPRAQQAGKLETRALFAGSQGGTVAPAGGNTCAPRSARLDLKGPRDPAVGYGPHRTIYLAGQTNIGANGKVAEGFRTQAVQGPELTRGGHTGRLTSGQGWPFELVVNLKTAKALGIEMPPMLLSLADEDCRNDSLHPRGDQLEQTDVYKCAYKCSDGQAASVYFFA